MKNRILPLLLFAFSTGLLYGQNVSYAYDAAGNRIRREITLPASNTRSASEQEETLVYSEMLSDIEVRIYPNPTEGLLTVEIRNLPDKQTADILLYNLSGKLITMRNKIENFVEVDLSSQPAGIYLLKIVSGEYGTEWKIIKK